MTFPVPQHPIGDRFVVPAVMLCIFAAFLTSVGILGWQVMTWLKTGVWPAMPTGDYLFTTQILGSQACAWIAQPDSWQGLHRIVVGLLDYPLWLSTFMVGVGLMWVVVKL